MRALKFIKVHVIFKLRNKVRIFWEATIFFQISTLDLSYVVTVQSKVEILQISAAFLEYMNLNQIYQLKTTSYFKMGQNSHTY